jgi:hypothetical protein
MTLKRLEIIKKKKNEIQQVEVWILGSQNSNLNFSIIKDDQNLNKKTTGCMLRQHILLSIESGQTTCHSSI